MNESFYIGSIKSVNHKINDDGLIDLNIEINNNSHQKWSSEDEKPIFISYHWIDENWKMVVFEGKRINLPEGGIAPGTKFCIEVVVNPPENEGNFLLLMTLVHEGICWFEGKNEFKPDLIKFEVKKNSMN